MISRGTGVIQRRNARNFHHKQADARLREAVTPYQKQGLNALNVDSFEVYYYPIARSTQICSCKQTEVVPEYSRISTASPINLVDQGSQNQPILIDYTRPLFGSANENGTAQDESDFDEFDIDEDSAQAPVIDNTFASTPNCGICYRTGFIPGYNRYGRERILLATHNMLDAYGFHMDVSQAPHRYNRLDDANAYVEFSIAVPKYFSRVFYSIRNNEEILAGNLLSHTGTVITFADLKYMAGQTVLIRVSAPVFTHAVIEFDLGTDPVLANMAQMSKTLDWTLFDTLGNMQLNLPNSIPEIHTSDLLYVPKRNVTLKITDVTYLRTSQDRNLDWSCTTRVLQPQELAKQIHRQEMLA